MIIVGLGVRLLPYYAYLSSAFSGLGIVWEKGHTQRGILGSTLHKCILTTAYAATLAAEIYLVRCNLIYTQTQKQRYRVTVTEIYFRSVG